MQKATAVEGERTQRLFSPTVGLAGFGVLLGWHFLILYFSFPKTGGMFPAEFIFVRQVVLNASLCIGFGVFGMLMRNMPQRDMIHSHTAAYISMALGAVGSSTLVVGSAAGIIWSILAVILIGTSEAVLMLFWLRFYTETSQNYSGMSLSVSAVLASLICFFTYHLTFEVSVFVIITLPFASGLLLITMTEGIPLRSNDPVGAGISDWDSARKPYWKATAQLMAMALFFGMVQGCSSPDRTLMPAADPVTVLGAGVAGIVLFVLYSRSRHAPDLGPVISTSLLMYVAGMLLLPFRAAFLSQVAAFFIMTGFIFYFILTLIFIIDLCRTFDLNATKSVGINQALEYAMFAVGVIAGNALWARFGESDLLPFAISSVAVFSLCAIVVYLTTDRPPWEAAYYKPKHILETKGEDSPEDEPEELNEIDLAALVSERFSLTPRETEVFALLSKGRNAEFIQKTLYISNHTVKTHIYNIYRKMGVHSLQELLDILDAEEGRCREDQSDGKRDEGADKA